MFAVRAWRFDFQHAAFISAIVVVSLGATPPFARWESPDKNYSIVVPTGWKQTEHKSKSGSSFGFTSPDQKAEIRISAVYHLNLPSELPADVLEAAFPNEKGLTDIRRIRSDEGWDGLRREYTNATQDRRWSAIAARNGSTVVLLTMTAPKSDFEQFEKTFKNVEESLKLRK